jgi:hypothetical protein
MNGLHCGRMTAEPEPSPRRWGLREIAAAVGVATVIAAFGGAAIYAASEGSSHSFDAPHQAGGPGPGRGAFDVAARRVHGARRLRRLQHDDHVVLHATVTDIGNPQQDGPSGPGPPPHRN